jgi:undecaprenyl-diphosphatase
MKLSWSHKIFLHINALIGIHVVRDQLMVFCARELIVVLGVFSSLTFFITLGFSMQAMLALFIHVVFPIVIGFWLSWGVGLTWKHPRPIIELPDVQQLVTPIQTKKSFPSDHTMMAVIFALAPLGVVWYVSIMVWIMACLVMVGRVYVGVHYPRDILGGIVNGGMAFVISLLLFV